MMKEAEDIILSKEYYELTPAEMEAVSEYAKNEEEYEDVKWFLTGTKDVFNQQKIEPAPGLKEGVFAHLHDRGPSKRIWLNSVGAFLFPADKKLHRHPGLQIAAVAIIAFGITFMIPDASNNEVAQVPVADDQIEEKTDLEKDKAEDTDTFKSLNSISNDDASGEAFSANEQELTVDTRGPEFEGQLEPLEEGENEESERFLFREENAPVVDGMTVDEDMDETVVLQQPATETIVSTDEVDLLDNKIDGNNKKDSGNQFATMGGVLAKNEVRDDRSKEKQKDGDGKKADKDDNGIESGYTTVDSEDFNTATGAVEEAPGKEGKVYKTSEAGGKFDNFYSDESVETEKKTPPTSLHIEQTKELKGLFFTVR